jgi:hypothetical protein
MNLKSNNRDTHPFFGALGIPRGLHTSNDVPFYNYRGLILSGFELDDGGTIESAPSPQRPCDAGICAQCPLSLPGIRLTKDGLSFG